VEYSSKGGMLDNVQSHAITSLTCEQSGGIRLCNSSNATVQYYPSLVDC